MKFKTLSLSLILASSLLVSFNSYALSVVEDVCNPDNYAPSFDETFEPVLSSRGYESWCSERKGRLLKEKLIKEIPYCNNPNFKYFSDLKNKSVEDAFPDVYIAARRRTSSYFGDIRDDNAREAYFRETFSGTGYCSKWIESSTLNEGHDKAVKWLTLVVEQNPHSRWALLRLKQAYNHSMSDLPRSRSNDSYGEPWYGRFDYEKNTYWGNRFTAALAERKKGIIKAAKKKSNNKPKTGGIGTGTGFVVTKGGVIATAEHVVDGCNKIEVDNLEASVVIADDKNDIALIKVNKTYQDIASIKVRSPKLGDDVMVFGYPLSGLLSSKHVSLTKGSVSSLSGMRDDTSRFRYTAASQPGNSGGPIVDDKGMVVGIVSAGLKNDKSLDVNWQNVNFGVRSSLLVNLMDSKNITVTTQEIPKEEIIGHYEKVSRYIKCFK